MSRNEVETNWQQFKELMLSQWGRLTDRGPDAAGKRSQPSGRMDELHGDTEEEPERKIDLWLGRR